MPIVLYFISPMNCLSSLNNVLSAEFIPSCVNSSMIDLYFSYVSLYKEREAGGG